MFGNEFTNKTSTKSSSLFPFAFVFEDGRVSIDPSDAGLIEYGTPGACSIDDHKNGRKGC